MNEMEKAANFIMQYMPLNITHFKNKKEFVQPLTTTKIESIQYTSDIQVMITVSNFSRNYSIMSKRILTSNPRDYQITLKNMKEDVMELSKIPDEKVRMACELTRRGTPLSILELNEKADYLYLSNTVVYTNILPVREYNHITIKSNQDGRVYVDASDFSIRSKPGYRPIDVFEKIYYGDSSWVSDEYAVLDETPNPNSFSGRLYTGIVV